MSPHGISKQLRKQTKDLPANPVTLKRDVNYDLVYYLQENQAQYPGVSVQKVYVRNYPNGSEAAQILGYAREVTSEQLKEPRYQGVQPGDQVGQAGVENTYDNVLRGINGMTRAPGGRRGPADGRGAQPDSAPGRRQPRCSPSTAGPERGAGRDRRIPPPRRLRGHEREGRRDPGPRLLAHLSTPRSSPSRCSRSRWSTRCSRTRPAPRTPTGRPRGTTRRDRRSSRSPRLRPWRAAC